MALSALRIRQARESAGLSRTEIALAIGRTEHTVLSYEVGRIVPPTDVITQIAEACDKHPGFFFDDAVEVSR